MSELSWIEKLRATEAKVIHEREARERFEKLREELEKLPNYEVIATMEELRQQMTLEPVIVSDEVWEEKVRAYQELSETLAQLPREEIPVHGVDLLSAQVTI